MPGAVTLLHGNASDWRGHADLVLTHPYAALPDCLVGKPMLINLFGDKKALGETWCRAELRELSRWGKGHRNTVYCANLERLDVDLGDLVEDNTGLEPGRGWFPLDLPLRLLRTYAQAGWTVWDGFMGRGTVGKACQILGLDYIGLDLDPERVDIARKYLGVT